LEEKDLIELLESEIKEGDPELTKGIEFVLETLEEAKNRPTQEVLTQIFSEQESALKLHLEQQISAFFAEMEHGLILAEMTSLEVGINRKYF